jgi:lipoprotein-anchoring transpeptidase ErfK/SrfK
MAGRVFRNAARPDWVSTAEMIRTQRYLPSCVAARPGNPLGPRAMYIGDTQCRIHGTNDSIDKKLSSVRVTDDDVIDVNGRMSSCQAAQPGAVGSVVGLY